MRSAIMMSFFSPYHLLSIFVEIGFVLVLYVCFRSRTAWAKRCVIISLMALNIAQHFFKSFIYPHMFGNGFGLENTVYNVCAFLILFSPIFHFSPAGSMRQAIAYIGSIAGIIAVVVPFWFLGKNLSDPEILSEYMRFWVCHALLFASSLLPILWHGVKFNYLDAWKFALYFLGMLCVLLLNNTLVCLAQGAVTAEALYEQLAALNPIGIMGPPDNNSPFLVLVKAAEALSPPVFLGGNGRPYTPILWYAFPVGIGVTVAGLLLGIIFDRKNFCADMKLLFLRKGTPPDRVRLTRGEYGYHWEKVRF